MISRTRLLSVVLTSLVACDSPVAPVPPEDAGTPDLTNNPGEDGGGVESPLDGGSDVADAGFSEVGPDAGAIDSGPTCPFLTQLTPAGCQSEVSVRLTGTAQAIRGSTLMVGTGQQPVLEAFVDSPPGIGLPEVSIEIAPVDPDGDAGVATSHEVATATDDDAGMHYDLPWATAAASEGLYVARAQATFGDAGFWSNPAYVLVDRTPPVIELTLVFDVDAGVQPRDFGAAVTVVAYDDGGSGEVGIGLSMAGVAWTAPVLGFSLRQASWVDLSPELPTVEGSRTTLESRVSGASTIYDAWSTAADGWKIAVRATATDLAGNSRSSEVDVPVARKLWQGVQVGSTGPVSLGAQGQILVNRGATLDALDPNGALQSSTKLAALYGGPLAALGRPGTLVSSATPTGETFVASSTKGIQGVYSQISSIGPFGSAFQTFSPPGSLPMAWAISASRASIYALPEDCGFVAVDVLTGETSATNLKPYPNCCSGAQLALGKNEVVASGPSIGLISTLPALEELWDAPHSLDPGSAFPPAFLGDLAVFNANSALYLYDTHDLAWAQVINPFSPIPANAVTSSQGDIYFLVPDGSLSKTDSNGAQLWTRKLESGSGVTGLVVGKGGDLIYAVDGSGQVSAYDSTGLLLWKSPPGTAEGDLMIDRCTGHAYAGVTGSPVSMVLDSLGVDDGPGAWPMGGHDVFQTFDSQGTADVDCAAHL